MDMYEKGDEEHINVMEEMKKFISDSEAIKEWMESKQKKIYVLPEDK